MAAHVIAPLSRADLYRPLLILATVLALCVVGLGAYVRLTDAGLGCPDWPGCYGHMLVPDNAADSGRAWREMIHRYAAGSLGLSILALTLTAWRRPQSRFARPWIETGLCGLVVMQALLGMWTVTELLKPVIVTAHLLGGMLSWAVLVVLCRREYAIENKGKWHALGGNAGQSNEAPPLPHQRERVGVRAVFGAEIAAFHDHFSPHPSPLPVIGERECRRDRLHSIVLGGSAALAVLLQIVLGGWVSSHYAGLACPGFPTCHGSWWPGGAAASIHWAHRLGAVAVLASAGTYAAVLLHTPAHRLFGFAIAAVLIIQLALGIANVLLGLPLPVGVSHNLGAALLLATVAVSLTRKRT